ncbi:nitrate/nitrite two-component system sensor histidine kinase NarX [Mangrovibacter phragmitis]|uniref:nitrate/nitrite two-component system sensor histidine kinase NarX n=1 Tax=Mangrovibacter phragmitis TaxID=1691903 RepID=UPI003512D404
MRKLKFWYHFSVMNTITLAMLCLSALAFTGMFISERSAESIQGNAHTINRIGAVRMQSYRILSMLPLTPDNMNEVNHLEDELHSPLFRDVVRTEGFHRAYQTITDSWYQQVKPQLLKSRTPEQGRASVEKFVANLNVLISQIDRHTEQQITEITITQRIFTVLTLLFLFIAILTLRKRLFQPWRQLLNMASAIQAGEFSHKLDTRNYKDEMGELGNALNAMAAELKTTYENLEQRVEEKTAQLQLQNRYLDFLYRSGREFNRQTHTCKTLAPLIEELMSLTPLRQIHLTFTDIQQSSQFENLTFGGARPEFCVDSACQRCLHTPDNGSEATQAQEWLLTDCNKIYGTLSAYIPADCSLHYEEQKLIATFCDLLTQYLALSRQEQHQRQLLLLQERSTIARELHDSIAQSLSYLKIKMGILQRHQDNLTGKQQTLIADIRRELDVTYKQLRELLTTFRLQLSGVGLLPAIEGCIAEYSQKLGFPIEFNYQIPANKVSPPQAIHLFQIIREALHNVYKHANASQVTVSLTMDTPNNLVHLNITDNGIGLDKQASHLNHYGLTIMADRTASLLGGKLDIQSEAQQGTQIHVCFTPTNEM